MRAIHLIGPSLDQLAPVDLPEPQPRRGEALVRLKAASLNYLDVAVASGLYPGVAFPLVPVADGAGEVVAVGDEVEAVAPGDRVAIHPKALWAAGCGTTRNTEAMRGVTYPGALRAFAAVDAATLVRVPPHLSWAAAASLPIAATTAWNALACADIGPGRTVVLQGTGNVSLFGLQLAKARGATVVLLSSSDEKLARAKALGADHGVNYRATPDWDVAVRDITKGQGADLVIESAGAATFAKSLAAARHGGTVFVIGFLSGHLTELDLLAVIGKALRIQGNNTGSAQDLAAATAAIAAHGIEPVIHRTFGLADLREAYETARDGGPFGKVTLDLTWS